MPLSTLECIAQSPKTKDHPAQNINSAEAEKFSSRTYLFSYKSVKGKFWTPLNSYLNFLMVFLHFSLFLQFFYNGLIFQLHSPVNSEMGFIMLFLWYLFTYIPPNSKFSIVYSSVYLFIYFSFLYLKRHDSKWEALHTQKVIHNVIFSFTGQETWLC